MKARPLQLALPVILLVAVSAYLLASPDEPAHTAQSTFATSPEPVEAAPTVDKFGIEVDDLDVADGTIRRNETLASVLERHDVGYSTVVRMAEASSPVFDVRSLRPGRDYRVYRAADSTATLRYFVYQPSATNYVVFDLSDSLNVYEGEREVDVVQRTADGVISGSLYQTLIDAGASPELSFKLAEMYAWQIDFYHLQQGDRFQVVYEEEQLDGEPVGLGDIRAAVFTHRDEDYYGFRFTQDSTADYFDRSGESLRKAFLKAPLRFTRISSRYDKTRFHPILKRVRPHLGTDYAAPAGTPVHSVGDGVVTEARYSRGNGRYVKIRHNATYTTQYLHFSKIADGVKAGVTVEQGDVIGYVGSTGLATGPHLCYRFWKDGKQVDPYKQQIPSAEPVVPQHRAAFDQVVEEYLPLLQSEDAMNDVLASAS